MNNRKLSVIITNYNNEAHIKKTVLSILNNTYKNLEVIAKSFNNRVEKNDPTAHAEIEAIRIAGQKLNNWRLDDCTLIVTLEPCQMCSGAILQSRISRVVFGAFEPKSGFLVSRNSHSENTNIEIISGVMEEESSKILSNWFRDKRSNKDMI